MLKPVGSKVLGSGKFASEQSGLGSQRATTLKFCSAFVTMSLDFRTKFQVSLAQQLTRVKDVAKFWQYILSSERSEGM